MPVPHRPLSIRALRGRVARLAAPLAALAVLLAPAPARALPSGAHTIDDAPPTTVTPPGKKEAPPTPANPNADDAFRIGALAGVGFPRPVSFEVMMKIAGVVGIGGEYGFLPSLTIDGVATSSWAGSADFRVFPFHGAFFMGLRGGYQHIGASATVGLAGVGSASGSAALDSWFLNPRIGFLFTMKRGFTIGIEAGAQIPVTTSFSSTLPSAVALQVRESTPVQLLAGVLPTVDLLRIGALF